MADVKTKNIVAYSALVLVLSVQLVIALAVIFSFIPIKLNSFVQTLLPLYWDQVRPEREMQFYAAFIIFGIALQAWGMIFLKKELQDDRFAARLWPFVGMQAAWVFIEATAAFKIFVFGSPEWAKWFLYEALGACILNTIFWPEFKKGVVLTYQLLCRPSVVIRFGRWFDALIPLIIVVLLWPPDMNKLMAHIFAWDYFFHLDFYFMYPGWAYLHGMTLGVDVNSNYSVLTPVLLSNIAKYCGGFNYENVLHLIIIGTLAYYVAAWAFLRYWLKSSLLAAFGILLAIKLQMFHWGVLPVVWRYPSATPIRYLFDLLPIFLIYQHAQKGREWYLWLAAAASGLMIAYELEVGVYLTLAFYAYIFMLVTLPQLRTKFFRWPGSIRKIIGMGMLPFIVAFIILWMVEGHWLLTSGFWKDISEYERLFLSGYRSLPYWDGLSDKQFFAFCMGFIIPAVYVLTMMIVGAFLYLQEIETPQIFIIYVCVYGLGAYHYFVYRSAVTSYYVVSMPFVFVLCFWIKHFLKPLAQDLRRVLLSILVVLTLGALVTGYLFTIYPNVFNVGRIDFGPEIAFYQKETKMDQDVALIDRLTGPEDRVALLSGLDTRILMQAKRKPFFYYFPMVYPEPRENLDFKGTEIITVDRMKRILEHLDNAKPPYVFIERKLVSGQLPAAYYQHYQALAILVRYLADHYQPDAQGEYLLALKRK